jgi:hypothetical protein
MTVKKFYMDKVTYNYVKNKMNIIKNNTGVRISQPEFSRRFILPKLNQQEALPRRLRRL